ncbi:putative nucleotidyltransferase substrate binding domain-containing protein [Alcanivorax sp. DP30]|uniref:putative nucleotidyltransferase substrate binding domain-containing protein n=1 Tax=Alcanivorax sp. DP30 TaxID=2606217 RepID=UPI00136B1568|nr:putative nucleotidyltransferase substrate binding domain-containing protein [Alcanivorax sp. DP30]MZR63504.1 CBS domain-containing protein [Alcanivorax sp. DP30]
MIEQELNHYPFTLLGEDARHRLNQGMDLAYFEKGDIILDAASASDYVYVVHKGSVAELDVTAPDGRSQVGIYAAGDLFGAISVINGKSRYRFRCEEQTLCHLIPAKLFLTLCNEEDEFGRYFRQTLAEKSQRLAERREGGVTLAGFMLARVEQCMREPMIMSASASLRDAVATLKRHGVDSVLVEIDAKFAIVTKTDLLTGLVMGGHSPDDPLSSVAERNLVTALPGDYLFTALTMMTRHKVARVVVMAHGHPVGVVELTDVLSFFSSRSYVVGLEIEKAEDLDALRLASERLPDLVQALMAQGVKMRFAMDLLAALNGRIMAKAFEMVIPAEQHSACLIVMGSEGRGEQILKTDQDNGLILGDHQDWPHCHKDAGQFTETLLTLGYPPCPGKVMVSNPEWVGTQSQWRERIHDWAGDAGGEGMIRITTLVDAHCVAGSSHLLDEIRQTLFDRCSDDEVFLRHFARPVLQFATPLNLFGSLKKPQHGIDIKKGALFPLVHGVRAMALQCRIEETSTLARLEKLVAAGAMEASFAEDLGEAMELFSELRLNHQLENLHGDAMNIPSNHIVVQTLSSLERDLLRDALHLVSDFKQRLSRRFHLEY